MNTKARQVLVTLTITVVFLFLVLYRVDLAEVRQAFSRTDYLYLLPVSLAMCLGLVIRALRWRYMLQSKQSIGTQAAFTALMIGYLVNNLLPARLGELARAYVLRRDEGISASFSLATIFVERILDMLVIMACLVIPLPFFSYSAPMKRVTILGWVILGIALIVLVLVIRWEQAMTSLAVRAVGRFSTRLAESVASILGNFVAGMRSLQGRLLAPVFVLSILAWLSSAAALYLASLAMDIPIPFGGALFTIALLGISMMIPASPGALGTYEFFAVSGLAFFGVERAAAISLALLLHMLQYVLTTGLGLLSLWSRGLSLQRVRTSLVEAEPSGPTTAQGDRL